MPFRGTNLCRHTPAFRNSFTNSSGPTGSVTHPLRLVSCSNTGIMRNASPISEAVFSIAAQCSSLLPSIYTSRYPFCSIFADTADFFPSCRVKQQRRVSHYFYLTSGQLTYELGSGVLTGRQRTKSIKQTRYIRLDISVPDFFSTHA